MCVVCVCVWAYTRVRVPHSQPQLLEMATIGDIPPGGTLLSSSELTLSNLENVFRPQRLRRWMPGCSCDPTPRNMCPVVSWNLHPPRRIIIWNTEYGRILIAYTMYVGS
jgi:hypothetical protein